MKVTESITAASGGERDSLPPAEVKQVKVIESTTAASGSKTGESHRKHFRQRK